MDPLVDPSGLEPGWKPWMVAWKASNFGLASSFDSDRSRGSSHFHGFHSLFYFLPMRPLVGILHFDTKNAFKAKI